MSGIPQRIGQLRDLHARLARHHFGLEREIGRLQSAVAPWFLFPGTQNRPRVIGLWGMTGTGKSSLVRALVRELGLEDITFWLDAGESHSSYWMDKLFGRLEEHMNGKPFVVVVDEFQHARMRDPHRPEPTDLRKFWEFLDSGRVVTWPNVYQLNTILDLHDRIDAALHAGARIVNGRVTHGQEKYLDLVLRHYRHWEEADRSLAIPPSEMETLRDACQEPKPTLPAFEAMIGTLDGPGIVALLRRLRITAQRPHVVDARQALVIVVGNLDELYHTGREPLAELHPDVLVHRHEDIGTAGVHHALLRMFRIEQVARLGADHVIFPPISKLSTERIIGHEVEALLDRLSASCGCELHVDPAVIDRIGRTAGATVMGARPVVEAVQRTIPALFAQVLTRHTKRITLMMQDDQPIAKVDDRKPIALQWPVQSQVDRRRRKDLERTAVHEAGHALCGKLLCGMRPLQVCAHTRDPEVRGFVVWDNDEAPVLRREIVPHLARMLGGLVAEKWKYGPDAISDGSCRDLRNATEFALRMVKEHGMGDGRIFHVVHPHADGTDGLRSGIEAVDAQARTWMEQAEQLALATIETHADVMERLVRELVEKRSLALGELDGVFKRCECESRV